MDRPNPENYGLDDNWMNDAEKYMDHLEAENTRLRAELTSIHLRRPSNEGRPHKLFELYVNAGCPNGEVSDRQVLDWAVEQIEENARLRKEADHLRWLRGKDTALKED